MYLMMTPYWSTSERRKKCDIWLFIERHEEVGVDEDIHLVDDEHKVFIEVAKSSGYWLVEAALSAMSRPTPASRKSACIAPVRDKSAI